jgi:hypothetical protein|tara:strand:+ start:29 stop:256 length:228 start_codon:yes stop_codon:yes gene_type:complete
MEYLENVLNWTKKLTEGCIALLALAVVLQVLFGNGQPFFPVDVVGNVVAVTKQLGSEGLVGLVSVGVLLAIFKQK